MRVKLNCWITSLTGIFLCICTLAPAAPPTWTISGTVQTAAVTAVEGVTVTGNNGATATVTAPDGTYTVTVPNHWDGTITVSKPGWLMTPTSKTYTNVSADIPNQNYTAYQPKISGTVKKSDGTPLQGAAVNANNSGGSDTTDASGYYEIVVPYEWSGALSATLSGYGFTSKNYANVTTDQINQNFTSFQPKISGYVRNATGTGLSGATVTANNGGSTGSTDINGFYQVMVPYNWSGMVTANKIKWNITPVSYLYDNVIDDRTAQDFTAAYISTIIVKADGTGDVPTIQAAIDMAEDGDIVQVEDGTYTGDGNRDIDFLGKAITVRGNVADPNLVVIDCQGTEAERHRGFKFDTEEGPNSVLEGFSISNGCATDERFYIGNNMYRSYLKAGSGIYCYNSSPSVLNCIVQYNIGRGIFCYGGNPAIENCTLSDNETGLGTFTSSPLLRNCTIKGNSPYGGINCDSGSPIVQDCTIAGNASAGSGGGIYCFYSSPVIQNCAITNNTATNSGGGIYLKQTRTTLIDCIISSNSSNDGGGICNYIGDPVIQNCDIKNNTAANYGGGIWLGTLDSPSIVHDRVTIQNCTIKNNTSMNSGGGIFLRHYTTGIVQNSTIADNSGTGIHCGGQDSGAVIENCTIINNNPYGIAFLDYGKVQNSIIWGNSLTQIGISGFTVTYSNIQGGYTGTGNINLNPLFGADGVHLTLDSPCINAGDISYVPDTDEVDIDGNPRVIGGRIDMGADEFSTDEPFILMPVSTLNFAAMEARDNPPSQNITFYNLSAQDLNWTTSTDVNWLTIAPTSGRINYEQTAEFTIAANVNDLPAGQFFGQIMISDPNAINSPKTIDVNLTVSGPSLGISQTAYSFTASKKTLNPESQVLTISNIGGGTLDWAIMQDCDWMQIEPTSGMTTGSVDVMLDIDLNNIEYGNHSCLFTVESSNATNSPQIVTVNLDVLEPEIGLSQNSLNFISDGIAGSPLPQVLTISNTGYDTLDWEIAGAEACDWLTIVPESGQTINGASSDVTLSVDPAIAGYGLYSCKLTISDPNASNSPQTVTVTLDVLRPKIGVSPASVGFECDVDDPNTFTQALTISNNGYDTLNWQIAEDYDWLSIEPTAGQCTSEPVEVTLTVNPAGLEIGTYTCNLTITDENASNSPVTVPVSLHIYRDGERHVPTEYPTLQQAIDAAAAGDHVIIHPGRYGSSLYSAIYYKGKAITVRSIDPTDPNIVAATILEGFTILFTQGEGRNSILDGLTINGSVSCYTSSPVIKNCIFSKSSSYNPRVIGIDVYQGNPHIQSCIFTGMSSKSDQRGASIYVDNNRNTVGSTIIENCLFSLKCSDWYRSGAIQIYKGHADIVNTTIAYCLVNVDAPYTVTYWATGAGLFIRESDVSIKNSIVWGNRGSDDFQIAVQNYTSVFGDPLNSHVNISYSNIEGGQEKILMFPDYAAFNTYQQTGILPDPNLIDPATLVWGPGNMDTNPLFAREPNDGGDGWFAIDRPGALPDYSPIHNNDYGDFHLKSQTGRFVWDGFARADFNQDKQVDLADFTALAGIWHLLTTNGWAYYPYDLNEDYNIDLEDLSLFCDDYLQPRVFGVWVTDDVTSPCIDAGDPNDPAWQNELWPHGERINMGAYGGTPQASLSPNPAGNPVDLNHDEAVDPADWPLLADDPEMNRIE